MPNKHYLKEYKGTTQRISPGGNKIYTLILQIMTIFTVIVIFALLLITVLSHHSQTLKTNTTAHESDASLRHCPLIKGDYFVHELAPTQVK